MFKSGSRVAVISPHLDDAVLSCTHFITELQKSSVQVEVFTIFTSFASSVIPIYSQKYMKICHAHNQYDFEQIRKEEDSKAMELLKLKYTYLDLVDGGFRQVNQKNIYRTFETLFSGTIDIKDTKTNSSLKSWFKKISPQFDVVVIPLGVGNHADHLITRTAAESVMPPSKLAYYIDQPYSYKLSNWTSKLITSVCTPQVRLFFTTNQKKQAIQTYTTQAPLLFPKGVKNYPDVILLP